MVQILTKVFIVGLLSVFLCGAAPYTSVNDGGTWREADEIHVNDSSTWRKIKRAWVNDSGTWRKTFVGLHITSRSLSACVGSISVRAWHDARLEMNGVSSCSFTTLTNEWGGDGTESGLGADYQIRITSTSGNCSVDPEFNFLNTWYDFDLFNPIQWRTNPDGCDGTWLIEVRDKTTLDVKASGTLTITT